MEIVTLEGLLNRSQIRRTSVADDVDDAMELLTTFESLCILEQNIVAYESAINIELLNDDISFEDVVSPNIIALEAGFGEGIKKVFEKIKQFFKGLWDFIVKQINKIINFFKGLGKHKKSSKEQETFNTILSTPPDKLEEKIERINNTQSSNNAKDTNTDSSNKSENTPKPPDNAKDTNTDSSNKSENTPKPPKEIKIPPIRKYAIAPETIIEKLLHDASEFIESFVSILSGIDFNNPDNNTDIEKRIVESISNTTIYDIKCSEEYGEAGDNYINAREWGKLFDEKILPNGDNKEQIPMKDAHITEKTFEYLNNGNFLKLLQTLENKMKSCYDKCTKMINDCVSLIVHNADDTYDKDMHNLHERSHKLIRYFNPDNTNHEKDGDRLDNILTHRRQNILKKRTSTVANDPIYKIAVHFKNICMTGLWLIQCVWGKIGVIAQELGSVYKQLDLMAAAFSNA